MLQHKTQIGRYDTRIVIQELVNVPDAYNQPIPTWSTFATVWAILDDRSGSESYQADQLTASRNTLFTIRYLAGLTELMRIKYADRYYDIQYIKSPDRKRTLEVGTILLDDPTDVVPAEGEGIFDLTFDSSFE